MSNLIGPTANLAPEARRIGRSGTVWRDGEMRGEIVAVEWSLEMEQIAVSLPGSYRTGNKPGGETLRGSIRFQDLDDKYAKEVLDFVRARRTGSRTAAAFPKFSLLTELDDVGAPGRTTYQLDGCQVYQIDGGFSTEEDLLLRDLPFTFDDVQLVEGFEYTKDGVVPVTA